MTVRKITHIALLTLLFSMAKTTVYGQQTIELQQCRETALKNNAAMSASKWKVEKAGYDTQVYKANYLPNFKLQGGALYNSWSKSYHIGAADIPLLGALGQAFPDLVSGFTGIDLSAKVGTVFAGAAYVEQPIYMGGKITAAYNMSLIGQEIARHNQQLTASKVLLKTDEAYVLAVKAKEMKKVAVKYNEMLQELYRMVDNSNKQGMVYKNDVLRVQVKLNESELQLRKADNAIRLSQMNLCHAMGIALNTSLQVSDTYPTAQALSPSSAVGIENRPEYAMLAKQMELADQQIKLSRSEFLPNVGLMAGYGYFNGLKFNDNTVLNSGSFTAMVSVSMPLFHFGEGANKVRAAKAQKSVVEMQRKDLNEQMELELAQAANNLDEARLEVDITTRSLAQADENVRLSQNQYKAGMATLADYMEAQTMWQKAYEAQVEAKYQHYLMQSKYLKAAGLLQ